MSKFITPPVKKLLDKPILELNSNNYLGLLILIAPLLNFLTGINVDLYAPSLPAIAHYYDASIMAVKNTITATMIGFALGCIIFGPIMDAFGRRRVILFGLMAYFIASFLALVCANIEQFIAVRFVQGLMISIASIGGRAIIMDNFTGHRLNVGLLYTSVAYGLGPIIAPFIGGILQYHFGWKANFIAYAVFAIALFLIFILCIRESLPKRKLFSLKNSLLNYAEVMKHHTFMAGVFIMAMSQLQSMVYPTVGAFLVENILHRTPIVYGNTALIISCGYLLGTIVNRLLIKTWHLQQLTSFGFLLLSIGLILQFIFALSSALNLLTIIIPITLMGFGNGFIFGNTLARCLQLFPKNVGVAIGLLSSLIMGITALGIFVISHVEVNGLISMTAVFAIVIASQRFIFFPIFTRGMETLSSHANSADQIILD